MYDIALHVKLKDWLYILIFGLVFGSFLSAFGYVLLEKDWLEGALYGVLLGFSITFLSLVFISFMNHFVLPKVSSKYWLLLAIVFSFLSGFFGTLLSVFVAQKMGIELIALFETSSIGIAAIIGVLTYLLGALLYRFVRMRNEKELVDGNYIKSRLSSLETQLNPHFLFNALNSIAELIHTDVNKAEEAVLKVSSFLRNTMSEESHISIKNELLHVRDYVELENIRFADKISLHVSDFMPNYKIPKFSIQLLVENAIKHGFIQKEKNLNIKISFDEQKKVLIVKNDGKAMKSSKFGIGLTNLNQRLELLCKGYLEVIDKEEPTFYIHLGECHENTRS